MDPAVICSALSAEDSSVRLRASLIAGSYPNPQYIDVLVARCSVEQAFFVRDMLTWALIHQERALALPAVLAELTSPIAQARAQALHTISKFAEPESWSAISDLLLFDADPAVARTAWRAAVILVPPVEREALAERLCTQLGRGDRDLQLSLSRELVNLGDAAVAALGKARSSKRLEVRTHAIATERLAANPESGFDAALEQATRQAVLQGAPLIDPTLLD